MRHLNLQILLCSLKQMAVVLLNAVTAATPASLTHCPVYFHKGLSYGDNWHKTKLHGLSPRANYTDRATAARRQSDCQVVRIEGAMWSA
jgi:hypothetical protein